MMKFDTPADVSVISEKITHTIPGIQINITDVIMPTDFNGKRITVVVSAKVTVKYEEQKV